MNKIFNSVKTILLKMVFHIVEYPLKTQPITYPPDLEKSDREIINTVRLFTFTSPERIYSVCADDYGEWQGARKATDEYIQQNNLKIFLNRIDYTGRLGIKI